MEDLIKQLESEEYLFEIGLTDEELKNDEIVKCAVFSAINTKLFKYTSGLHDCTEKAYSQALSASYTDVYRLTSHFIALYKTNKIELI